MTTDSFGHIRDIIKQLQSPILDVHTLLCLLCGPLDALGILPPHYRKYNTKSLPSNALHITRHIPLIQQALLEHIEPTWGSVLKEEGAMPLLDQFFCPDTFSFSTTQAGQLTVSAYSTILFNPLSRYSIHILSRLAREYPLDRLHGAIFFGGDMVKQDAIWESCVRDVLSVPSKVANMLGEKGSVPGVLEHGAYLNNVCRRTERLIASSPLGEEKNISSIAFLLTKLVNHGVFPSAPPTLPSQPSFFQATLSDIYDRFTSDSDGSYSRIWNTIFQTFPSVFTVKTILTSLVVAIPAISPARGCSSFQRASVRENSQLLSNLVKPISDDGQLWDSFASVVLDRNWDEGYSRIFVCWIMLSDGNKGLCRLLNVVLERWASSEHIQHSLLTQHRYVTSLFLVGISCLPPSCSALQSLASSTLFIRGVGKYIGHLDTAVRICGMLVGEVLASLIGKKLDFEDWDGNSEDKEWARQMRELIKQRDLDSVADLEDISSPIENTPNVTENKSVVLRHDAYDSDDSMSGYASPSSSRSSSPTPSELDELEKDPTLGVGAKKIPRPVYLAQLGQLVRGTPMGKESTEDVDKTETALNYGEELIRRKEGYGAELEENAVNLVHAFIGLTNNYNLEGFATKRQGILNALVACCSRKSSPSIIEEFYKNQYSADQRFVMLNALVIGARELSSTARQQIKFPSKILSPSLHQKYIAQETSLVVPRLLDAISDDVLRDEMKQANDQTPSTVIRERRLRMPRTGQSISEVDTTQPHIPSNTTNRTTFTEVAAEFFIMPMMNHFWQFLRDEQTREERTSHLAGRFQYRAAGTGLILSPLVLTHFLSALAILVYTSQNSPQWISIIVPDALMLALTLGTKRISLSEEDRTDDEGGQGKQVSVVVAALELTLVILAGSIEVDGGRSLSIDHTVLLLDIHKWAETVFAHTQGLGIQEQGGTHKMKLQKTSAGVLLKVDYVRSQWGRSIVDISQ